MSTTGNMLPCPFCAGCARLRIVKDGPTMKQIVCMACDANGAESETVAGAVAAWNRRAPSKTVLRLKGFTLATQRERFEAVIRTHLAPEYIDDALATEGEFYAEYGTGLAWTAFQAAEKMSTETVDNPVETRRAAPAPAGDAEPQKIGVPDIILTAAQLLEALDFIAPDRATDPEQLEATVAIQYGEGHGGKAHYVWCAEYPEEGSFVLDGSSAHASDAAPAASVHAVQAVQAVHSDDDAVDTFARVMKSKLAEARAKGRSGWEQIAPANLSRMLRVHVDKGDPRDVANFCMFLWHLDARIAASDANPIYQVRLGAGTWEDTDAEEFNRTPEQYRRVAYETPHVDGVRAFLTECAGFHGQMVKGNWLSAEAARLLRESEAK